MRTTKIAPAAPFSGAPKINLASIFGASPNKPFLLRIPVTGERPIRYGVQNLPEGLSLCDNIVTGQVTEAGIYEIVLTAENSLGKAEKAVTLEIHPNHVIVTPLLGFTTWNAFASRVTQQDVTNTAHNLVKHGLTEYGYRYVNLDSGWQHEYGGELDAIQPNPKFPDMKAMTDEIHSLGLKCGIYSTPMLTAWGCPKEYKTIPGCTQGEPDIRFAGTNGGIGVIHKEENNAKQWEKWGFDYLKYDWNPTDTVNAELMRQQLLKLDRDFGFCVTVNALYQYVSYWSKYCNSYRKNTDSQGFWKNLLQIYNTYEGYEKHMSKGHYFDLDMLDVGNCVFNNREDFLTEDEQIVSYSLRAFLNSPIQISAVLDEISDFDLAMYCNEEIIAINQDAAFAPSVPVFRYKKEDAILDVYEKLLEDGSYAYAFFNMGETSENITATFSEKTNPRDVWAKEDFGALDTLTLAMPKHTARIIKSEKKAISFETNIDSFKNCDKI